MVNDLYLNAWLPMRNFFTPVMKLIKKQREGSKVLKTYDEPATPYQRLMSCAKLTEETKSKLKKQYEQLDPIDLAKQVEIKLGMIFEIINQRAEERREEDLILLEMEQRGNGDFCFDSVSATVA